MVSKIPLAAAQVSTDAEQMGAFYALRLGEIWKHFKREHFSFWMICGYLFIEYVRPQSIVTFLDFLPWAQIFLLMSLVGLLSERRRKWVNDSANLWITLFLLVIVVSSAAAIYPQESWNHFMDFFGWYVIYFLIINIVTTEKRFFVFLLIFLIASFKLSWFGARTWTLRGFSFTSWGLMGPPGFFQNSGELAIQMLMFLPIAYEFALFLRPWVSKAKFYFLMFVPLTAAMTIMGASSRGGQVGLVYQIYRLMLKGRVNVKTLLVVGIVVAAGYALLPDQQKARFSATGEDKTSQQRLLYWEHGMDMIKEYPVLGVGYFNFAPYYAAHFPEDMMYGNAELPHNIFIQVGTDAGVLGLAIFAMILIRHFRALREIRAAPDEKPAFAVAISKGLTVALWGFLIAGQFVTVTYYPFLWINLALSIALRNIVRSRVDADAAKGGAAKPARS